MGPSAILDVVMKVNSAGAVAEVRRFDSMLRRTDKTTASATLRTSRFGSATGRAGQALRSAAGYAAGAAAAYLSISQAKAAITTTQDLAKTTAGLNRNLGFTTKRASEWASIAKSRDVDPKSLTMSFTTLSRRLTDTAHALHEGGGAAESAMVPFTRLGLSQEDIVKGSRNLTGFLPKLADAFGEAEGGAKRQASAQQLLGRGYQSILPLFAEGAEGLRDQQKWADRYGATLTDKTLKAQMDLVMAQRETKVAWLGMQMVFAQAVTPALKEANKQFQQIAAIIADDRLTNAEKFKQVAKIIEGWAKTALDAFVTILPQIAERAAEAAPRIAGALVEGFLNAPPLAMLFAGAWMANRFAGLISLVAPAGSRLGAAFGTAMMAGVASAFGGLVNIIGDLKGGDLEGAAFEAGGGIAGALVGGLVGGLPGALIGSGIGTIVGDFIGDAFSGGKAFSKLGLDDLSKSLGKQAERAREALHGIGPAIKQTSREIATAREKDAAATRKVRRAEEHLREARRQYPANSREVRQAERRVADAKEDSLRASRRLAKAERKSGYERDFYKQKLRDAVKAQAADVATKREQLRAATREFKQLQRTEGATRATSKAHKEMVARQRALKEATHQLTGTFAKAERFIGPKFAGHLEDISKRLGRTKQLTAAVAQVLENRARRAFHEVGLAIGRGGAGAANSLNQFNENLDKIPAQARRVVRQALKPLRDGAESTGDATKDSGKKQEQAWNSVSGTVRQAFKMIGGNTNRILKQLGLDPVSFGISDTAKPQKRQAGGVLVGGSGSGDKVPALLEPGEVVVNREAVKAMGGAKHVNKINSLIPRFQGGGIARFAKGGTIPGDTGGLDGGILGLVNRLYQKFGGSVSSGYRPTDAGSLHSTHQAADYVPSDWAGAARAVNALGSQLLEGIYNPVRYGGEPVSWDSGSHVPSSFWTADTWADHWDHIHLAVSAGREVAGEIAGAVARVKQIVAPVLEGPRGPMLDAGQGAANRVTAAANAYIKKHAPSQAGLAEAGKFQGKLGAATVKGRATWFTGGLMASGLNTDTDPGIALNPNAGGPDPSSWNNPTTRAWLQARQPFLVKIGGKQAVLPVLDMGPAGWTGNAIDVNRAGVTKMGFTTSNFPSGTIGTATLVKKMLGGIIQKFQGGGAPEGSASIPGGDMGSLGGAGSGKIPIVDPGLPSHYGGSSPDLAQAFAEGAFNTAGGGGGGGTGDPIVPKLPGVLSDFYKSESKAQRSKMLRRFSDRIQKFGLPKANAERIADLLDASDEFATNAEHAATVEGPFRGQTELEWLREQLDALMALRNELIDAQTIVDRYRKKMERLLSNAKEKLTEWADKVRDGKKERDDLSTKLEKEATRRDELEKALEEEKKLGKGKRNPEKIERLTKQIEDSEKRTESLKKKVKILDREQEKRGYVVEALKGDPLGIIAKVGERVDGLKSGDTWSVETLADQLETVHGLGSPLTKYPLGTYPPLDTLAGDIFDVRWRIQELMAQAGEGRDPLTIEELKEFADVVSLGAFSRSPYGAQLGAVIPAYASGGLHAGGLALVGEKGPEIAELPPGTRVRSNQESQGALNPTIYADIYIGSEKIAEKVQMAIKRNESATLGAWRAGAVRR